MVGDPYLHAAIIRPSSAPGPALISAQSLLGWGENCPVTGDMWKQFKTSFKIAEEAQLLDDKTLKRAQTWLGLGAKGSTVPNFFWSDSLTFHCAASAIASIDHLTVDAVYAATATLRRSLNNDDEVFVGWLPIEWTPQVYSDAISKGRCLGKRDCPLAAGDANGNGKTLLSMLHGHLFEFSRNIAFADSTHIIVGQTPLMLRDTHYPCARVPTPKSEGGYTVLQHADPSYGSHKVNCKHWDDMPWKVLGLGGCLVAPFEKPDDQEMEPVYPDEIESVADDVARTLDFLELDGNEMATEAAQAC